MTNDYYDWEEREARKDAFQKRLDDIGRFLPPEAESERLERGNTTLLEVANDTNDTLSAFQAEVAGLHGLPSTRETEQGSALQGQDTL